MSEITAIPMSTATMPTIDRYVSHGYGEGTHRGLSDRHLPEHPHYQDEKGPRQQVGEDGRRARLVEDRSGPHKETGPDNPAERDHGHVPPL
jgi:hypothetical protein